MKKVKQIICLAVTLAIFFSVAFVPGVFADGVKYTVETTKEGWTRIINDNGIVLGYTEGSGVTILEDDGYAFKDMNKNGQLDPFEDWRLDVSVRALDAAAQLTNDQIVPLMLLGADSSGSLSKTIPEDVQGKLDAGFRSLTSAPSGSVANIVAYSNLVQAYVEALGIGMPVDFQGEPDLSSAASWPTNVGLSATFNPQIVLELGKIRGQEYRAMGVTSANMPQIDIAMEPRWLRVEGTFSESPDLCADMAQAYLTGLQSTFDADGNDLGWGADSVAGYVKHFPGDGAGESGRESHSFTGKYNVKPGGQLQAHLQPFVAAFHLDSATGSAAGVMPSYSIGLDENGEALGGEMVGSGFSNYKVTQLLRGELGFDGVVLTDYGIMSDFAPWGVETRSEGERCLMMIEAGTDRAGSYDNLEAMQEGVALYAEKYGKEALTERLQQSAQRIAGNMLKLGLFENPYLTESESKAKLNTEEQKKAASDVQAKTVVMLKNTGGLIHETDGSKPTVYIPLEYAPATEAINMGPFSVPASPARFELPINIAVASRYFNVVTDTVSEILTGPADENGDPTVAEADVIHPSEEQLAACDFTLVFMDSPLNQPAYMGKGYNNETGEYIPISLQYRPYTADSEAVRRVSISGDILPDGTKENRSYFGKTSNVSNEKELDKVLDAVARTEHVVVVMNLTNPTIVSEFESQVDGLLVHFGGVEDKAICEILSGNVEPSALLPFQMPANMETVEAQLEDVPFDMECYVDAEGHIYDFAFGLNWSGVIDDERVAAYGIKYTN